MPLPVVGVWESTVAITNGGPTIGAAIVTVSGVESETVSFSIGWWRTDDEAPPDTTRRIGFASYGSDRETLVGEYPVYGHPPSDPVPFAMGLAPDHEMALAFDECCRELNLRRVSGPGVE